MKLLAVTQFTQMTSYLLDIDLAFDLSIVSL